MGYVLGVKYSHFCNSLLLISTCTFYRLLTFTSFSGSFKSFTGDHNGKEDNAHKFPHSFSGDLSDNTPMTEVLKNAGIGHDDNSQKKQAGDSRGIHEFIFTLSSKLNWIHET